MNDEVSGPERLVAFTPMWEYECCGEPLMVNDVVDLVTEASDVGSALHTPKGRPVTRYHGRHWSEISQTVVTRGRVIGLWEVSERPGEPSGRVLGGRENLHEVDAMRYPSETDDSPPVGWLIELQPFGSEPPDPVVEAGEDSGGSS